MQKLKKKVNITSKSCKNKITAEVNLSQKFSDEVGYLANKEDINNDFCY